MKRVSKVVPSRRKKKVIKWRPWVLVTAKVIKFLVKGLFYIAVILNAIYLLFGGAFSKADMNKSIEAPVKEVVVDTNINTTMLEIPVVEEKKEEPVKVEEKKEEVKEVEETRKKYACSSSSVKSYMDYKAITNTSSTQYKYIKNYMTVGSDGYLRDADGNIGVALGSYFGPIGTKYEVHLDTGIVFNIVKVEAKADEHTVNGCYQKYDKSVIEFVIDSSKMSKASNGYVWSGNFNNNPDFKGKITAMYKID